MFFKVAILIVVFTALTFILMLMLNGIDVVDPCNENTEIVMATTMHTDVAEQWTS
jgi:hypothetical protein